MKKPTPLKSLLLTVALGMTTFTFSTAAALAVTDTLHKSQPLAQMPEGIKADASMKHQ